MTDPCSFEDQVRINRVRDALWGAGSNGASVMVGAGFSKNAEIRQPDRVRLPDWTDLTTAMHHELHPDARADATIVSGAMDAPAIAQDYYDEFGRRNCTASCVIKSGTTRLNPVNPIAVCSLCLGLTY